MVLGAASVVLVHIDTLYALVKLQMRRRRRLLAAQTLARFNRHAHAHLADVDVIRHVNMGCTVVGSELLLL